MIQVKPLESREVTDNMVLLINSLAGQLEKMVRSMTVADLLRVVQQQHGKLFLAYLGGSVVGMVTAIINHYPSGSVMFVRDFMIDQGYQHPSLVRSMLEKVIEWTSGFGVDAINVVSSNQAQIEHALVSLGFSRDGASSYCLNLDAVERVTSAAQFVSR